MGTFTANLLCVNLYVNKHGFPLLVDSQISGSRVRIKGILVERGDKGEERKKKTEI
jgi:hypothetical protein